MDDNAVATSSTVGEPALRELKGDRGVQNRGLPLFRIFFFALYRALPTSRILHCRLCSIKKKKKNETWVNLYFKLEEDGGPPPALAALSLPQRWLADCQRGLDGLAVRLEASEGLQ